MNLAKGASLRKEPSAKDQWENEQNTSSLDMGTDNKVLNVRRQDQSRAYDDNDSSLHVHAEHKELGAVYRSPHCDR